MGRNGAIDNATLLAAFGIVLFHAGTLGAAIGYAGLPFFLILLVLRALPAAECMSFTDFAALRAQCLLRLWLIWSAVYATLKLAEVAITGAPLRTEFNASMILTGQALHLWFLPFAFAASLWVYGLARLRQVLPVPVQTLCAVLLLAALALLSLHQRGGLPVPVAQWVFDGPAVCRGSIFALLARGPCSRPLRWRWWWQGWSGLRCCSAGRAACCRSPLRARSLPCAPPIPGLRRPHPGGRQRQRWASIWCIRWCCPWQTGRASQSRGPSPWRWPGSPDRWH
jgi:hypothetical protein